MKKLLCLIVFLSFSTSAFSGEYSQEYLKQKLGKFKTMRTTGIVLTSVGIPMAVVGIPMYFSEANKDADDVKLGKFLGGAVLMVVGELSVIGGVVLWAFGHSRVKRYRGLLEQKEYGLNLGVGGKGVQLQYRF